jgi:hypothetical protein
MKPHPASIYGSDAMIRRVARRVVEKVSPQPKWWQFWMSSVKVRWELVEQGDE